MRCFFRDPVSYSGRTLDGSVCVIPPVGAKLAGASALITDRGYPVAEVTQQLGIGTHRRRRVLVSLGAWTIC